MSIRNTSGSLLAFALAALSLSCTGKHGIPIVFMKEVASQYDAGHFLATYTPNYEGARESFATVVSLAPGFAEGHHNLGVCLAHLGEWQASLGEFERALEINQSLHLSAQGAGLAKQALRGEAVSSRSIPRLCRQFHELYEQGC